MILAVDVQYDADCGYAAGLLFERWDALTPAATICKKQAGVGEYVPGEFYKRELPCILALLGELDQLPEVVVIDGFVFLDGHSHAGLGKHLYDALDGKAKVIGVAKTSYAGIGDNYKLLRGDSIKPLFITCIGLELAEAKEHIAAMHGPHRMPVLLKTVDRICREQALAGAAGIAQDLPQS
ncbi:endonuclease V [Massilia violaceinigra]|uniref:Endonuclease V n=1 Tax=Massilia violaceinigra TaxID=2045208 RepID=A0A2D2DGW9_9BURK|nr:endonuclease V [Massilia violaceinigra]ATQ74238.1 endonuclease V [Massilia violaceinigra]